MNSKIILAKNIEMDREYINVLNYTEQQMVNLVSSQAHLVASANNYSFIPKEKNAIKVNFTYSQCLRSNYIAFQNPDYSNKWFFAWIDDIIKLSESAYKITYTIDVWSTWFSKLVVKPCYVIREHTNDDTIGLNTLPENLDVGEVIQESYEEITSLTNDDTYYIGMMTDWILKDGSIGTEIGSDNKGTQFEGISVYDGTVFANKLIVFKIENISDFSKVANYILRTNSDGHIEDIKDLFIIPGFAFPSTSVLTSHSAYAGRQEASALITFYTINYSSLPRKLTRQINRLTQFSDYTPKNRKMFLLSIQLLICN